MAEVADDRIARRDEAVCDRVIPAAWQAACWWSVALGRGVDRWWLTEAHRALFRHHLALLLDEEFADEEQSSIGLTVDYDPSLLLVEAARAAGLTTTAIGVMRGRQRDSDGEYYPPLESDLFPNKTRMWVSRENIEVWAGYGAGKVTIPVSSEKP